MTQAPPAASAPLRRALAEARSPRVPRTVPYVPERALPWGGPGLPLDGPGGAVDLDRALRLSLAAPREEGGRLRPVPSAGALHPVRAHLLVGPGCSLPPGRYAYDPRTHRAHPRGPAPADAPPGTVAVLTVVASRTVAHYGHRAWPLLLLDAGHAAAALALAAAPGGVRVSLDADGTELAAAAGLPRAAEWEACRPGGEPELPLVALWLPPAQTPPCERDPLAAWSAHPRPRTAAPPTPGAGAVPAGELGSVQSLLDHLTRASRPTWHPAHRPAPVTDDTLRTRRSADPADLTPPPAPGLLAQVLTTAHTARPDGPAWVAAVGGDTPGLRTPTGPLASGDARPTLARWAAGQRWIGTAGAVLVAHGCPADAPPALVRRSHLAAGYAAGAAQAHATALGLRSRPIGSWQQADLGAALGDAPGQDWIIHGLALAAPPAPPYRRTQRPTPPTPSGKEERP
ncbi:nitroreductase [Streptomyces sp. 196(2019)]|uniref:nitroreductase n=1 Tax=Streptomyces sp. 196(2019) TaxID=2683820 RepID=UPI0013EE22AD|nr:nitroreductase [Streptomyces sp. 196(2019)]NGO86620.1 nitroreductase [Streptomyces sp. 196(2019)]